MNTPFFKRRQSSSRSNIENLILVTSVQPRPRKSGRVVLDIDIPDLADPLATINMASSSEGSSPNTEVMVMLKEIMEDQNNLRKSIGARLGNVEKSISDTMLREFKEMKDYVDL